MRLLFERGYDRVTVDDIALAAGVGRSTFFRYFGTKAAVVWRGFDRSLRRLAQVLADQDPTVETMQAILEAIRQAVLAGTDDRGVWWERFVLLDSVPALRGEAASRWDNWIDTIASFIAERMGVSSRHPAPVAIATALQGVYLTTLRNWEGRPGDPEEMLARMLWALEIVATEMRGLLEWNGAAVPTTQDV